MEMTEIFKADYPEGDFASIKVSHENTRVWIIEYDQQNENENLATLTREEAIAAARAILKHFGELL